MMPPKPPRGAVTIKDIAQVLGLAHTTVSRALNDHPKLRAETKQLVREAAAKLGYVANSGARAMRSGAMPLVGLIVPDVQNEFYSAAASAMAHQCVLRGYQLMLGLTEDDPQREEQQIRAMRESRAAGVLLVPSPAPTAPALALLRDTPVVQFLRIHPGLGPLHVVADDRDGTEQATRHLIAQGHRRIAFVGPALGTSTAERRLQGHQSAMRRAGLHIDPELQQFGPTSPDAGAVALARLMALSERPSAVLVASSRQVAGILRAASALAVHVPDALSIVSYGDADWFTVCQPPVTAMALQVGAMCDRATGLLFEVIDAAPGAATTSSTAAFRTTLMTRSSVAQAPP